jgi:hypothetical protein
VSFGYEWVDIPDLYAFLQVQVLEAAVRAIIGEYISPLNPTFVQNFWEYDRGIRGLFMRTPRWVNPGIYRARDRMLEISRDSIDMLSNTVICRMYQMVWNGSRIREPY